MNTSMRSFLYWFPRTFHILFILFISLFALDVFGGNEPWWRQLIGFSIHLILSIVLILGMVVAWRYEWFGFLTFIGFAVWYFNLSDEHHWSEILILVVLPILISLLWLIGWIKRDEICETTNTIV